MTLALLFPTPWKHPEECSNLLFKKLAGKLRRKGGGLASPRAGNVESGLEAVPWWECNRKAPGAVLGDEETTCTSLSKRHTGTPLASLLSNPEGGR